LSSHSGLARSWSPISQGLVAATLTIRPGHGRLTSEKLRFSAVKPSESGT